MKITVLGCGGSSGVPMIGPDWGACDPNNPKNRRRRVSILVEDGDTTVLVDTPADMREQCLDAGVRDIDAVVYTHGHADHSHGLDDLRGFNYIRDGSLDVFGTPATLDSLNARFSYAFRERSHTGAWYRPALTPRPVTRPFRVGALDIVPFEQEHGRATTLGLRFGAFAYSTDASGLSDDAFAALDGIDTWLVDCVRYTPSPGHAHLPLTLSWIERLAPRRAILTHMAADFDYETLRAELPDGVEPAYDGMVIEVE